MRRVTGTGLWLMLFCLAACQGPPEVRFHDAGAYPERLSDWGLLVRRGDRLVLGDSVEPYAINTPLFSDYALKLRTVYLPPGARMSYRDPESFQFPVGSVITKTFFYPRHHQAPQHQPQATPVMEAREDWHGDVSRLDLNEYALVETRLLVRQTDGWEALPYVWEGDDAFLRITGEVRPMRLALADGEMADLPYVVPARSECAGCHATDHTAGKLQLIGLKARHLNRAYPGATRDQLHTWAEAGHLEGLPATAELPRSADWRDPDEDLEARARAYLDSNCGHCHNPSGAADTSGLHLDAHTSSYRALGFCKAPVAAGRGTGGRPFSIVPGEPDRSILIYRTETVDPATRMPEVGRALTHREGVELLRRWVASLPGECV